MAHNPPDPGRYAFDLSDPRMLALMAFRAVHGWEATVSEAWLRQVERRIPAGEDPARAARAVAP